MRSAAIVLAAGLLAAAAAPAAEPGVETVALRDLGHIEGWRSNPLVGYGLVTGLAGTGDSSRNRATRQSISNMLAKFGLYVPIDQVQSRNAAAVMVTAELPPFARAGDQIDVTVTSVGDARSLLGGALLMTPLRGPDGKVRALAQGPLAVGGYQYELNGTVQQKNHPTTGTVPLGATVEADVHTEVVSAGVVRYRLADPDYAMASRVAGAINGALGAGAASARDGATVDIAVGGQASPDQVVALLTRIEGLEVTPVQRSRVVINERTGTVVSGGDVRISKVTISQGDLKVSIVTERYASQPSFVTATGPGVRTVIVPNTHIDVTEGGSAALSLPGNNTVADLVMALNKVRTSTRDIISILQAMKAAGALHADLVIQ